MAWINAAVKASCTSGAVPKQPLAIIMNRTALRRAMDALRAAFPASALHTFAAKANSLKPVLAEFAAGDFGCETASIGEFEMATRVFPVDRIVFDSPVKTHEELERALYAGGFLNVDNFQELDRVAALHAARPVKAVVGIRVNPQIGAGAFGVTSTGTSTSKFGVGLVENADRIVDAFKQHAFLRMLHVHTGSAGIDVSMAVDAIATIDALRARIGDQVTHLDIGGGLAVNFASDDHAPTFADYAEQLRAKVPHLFDPACPVRLITEFGRSLCAKEGVVVSRVEYTKTSGGRFIVQQHAGADLLTRWVWAPKDWRLRADIYSPDGVRRTDDEVVTDVAGPCCLGGDLAVRETPLPRAQPGDVVVLKDLGGYCLSSYSYYNLRQAPAVYMFDEGTGELALVRKADTVEDTLRFMQGC